MKECEGADEGESDLQNIPRGRDHTKTLTKAHRHSNGKQIQRNQGGKRPQRYGTKRDTSKKDDES